jgi:hypothetical protein
MVNKTNTPQETKVLLNTGKKNCALRDKKINILTLVLSEEKILNETINLSSFLNSFYFQIFVQRMVDNTMGNIGQKDNG